VAKKFYAVWNGRETGVFFDWPTCKKHTYGYPNAGYKSFTTLAEAEAAVLSMGTAPSAGAKSKPTGSTKKKSSSGGAKTLTADEIEALPVTTKIFTDGGCEPNPGEAGSGLAVYRDGAVSELWFGLYNPEGTNNTAELSAFKQALVMAETEIRNGQSIAIFCDSTYSIQCITQWAAGWKRNGWKKKTGEIKNLSLIKEMFALHQSLKDDVQVFHVKGHAGVEGNELADRMSILAIEAKEVDFCLFRGKIDVPELLAMRAG
jgi:ribonuclease HI